MGGGVGVPVCQASGATAQEERECLVHTGLPWKVVRQAEEAAALASGKTDTFFFWFAPKQVVDCAPTHLFPVRVSSRAYLKNWAFNARRR